MRFCPSCNSMISAGKWLCDKCFEKYGRAAPENFTPKEDSVNRPSHYIFGDYELIDIIKAWLKENDISRYESFLWSSLVQYLFRYQKKKGLRDLKKCEFYLRRLLEENGG